MPRIVKSFFFCTIIAIVLLSSSLLEAQQPTDPPRAPVPVQIITGKKAFISNASGESVTPAGVADLTYNQFYDSMKSWGRYELVSVPADADLVLEIRYEAPMGPVNVSSGNGGSGQYPQIRLSILDPKTHMILWAFTEPVRQVRKHATELQNFKEALATLMADVRTLAAPASASPHA